MKRWLRSGLVWGGVLYIIAMIIFPIIDGETLSYHKILFGIPFWIVVGLIIGYLFEKRKKHQKTKH
ncbi:hypothetical protein GN157_10535 [Flavobacterium rakeshii]|uniref:Uncharacterized protein n=1 Tax=Flavobacterium rakeshii TaxID=1038845 RepID=A0A6N8HE08_9FLAO|nr:hypothetical protein [Flavobacterium rakeshii]MEE1898847.1 hypothetical protein [Flavobacterium rakeshii]MUV04145.1 hypothetical protein [Flavobacterium rakeshii]